MTSIHSMNDDQWEAAKQQYKRRIGTILIPLDVTAGVAKGILSRIDSFFSEAVLDLSELEGRMERINSIITEWERTKISGSSDMLRKMNASVALQNYPIGEGEEETLNMYEVYRTIYDRHAFLKGIIRSLESKRSSLITVLGLLKLEKDLSPFSSNE